MFDGLIVSGLREMVESDGQCVGGQVGCEIRLGLEDLAQQSACSHSSEARLDSAR